MALETGDYIADLDFANPPGTDPLRQGADHLRLVKKVIKQTFPNYTGRFGRVSAKSSSYTILIGDNSVAFALSGSGSVLTLPDASTLPDNWVCSVVVDGGAVATLPSIARSSTNTLTFGVQTGLTSVALRPNEVYLVRRASASVFQIEGGDRRQRVIEDVLAGAPFWNYAPNGGTADQPAEWIFTRGTQKFKGAVTWGTSGGEDGNPTNIVWSFSGNTGTNYTTFATVAIAYDANGDVTSTTWS